MDKRTETTVAEGALPLASLRLMASPLQLTYSYMWQAIRQKNVKEFGKVEEFVTMVTQTVPELMTVKQTAQLILGLRARVILDLLKNEDTPDLRAVQALVNKFKVSASFKDAEVEKSENNFMVLIQTLLKNPAEKKHFFQHVFPVHYGPKFDTALQTLIAGLVCKLEQLVPVPNLSQLGALISADSAVLEACADFIPSSVDLKTLLVHQQAKGLLNAKGPLFTVDGSEDEENVTAADTTPDDAPDENNEENMNTSEGSSSIKAEICLPEHNEENMDISERTSPTKAGRRVSGHKGSHRRKNIAGRKPWTKLEANAVMRHFKSHITKGLLATKKECEDCKSREHPALQHRTFQNIRDFVRNKGVAFKRQMTEMSL